MHGNVREWCQDWYHKSYVNAPSDGSAPASVGEEKNRVTRGGSWRDEAKDIRSAYRLWKSPKEHSFTVGVRIVAVRNGS